jgi:hypothetical protein
VGPRSREVRSPDSTCRGRLPSRLWVELPRGVEELGLFRAERKEGPGGRPTAVRAGLRQEWYQSKAVEFSLFR